MKKSCSTCKYDDLTKDLVYGEDLPDVCLDCYDEENDVQWLSWTPKEESDPLKGEFYVRLICDINGTDVEVSETKLNDFVKNIAAEVTESVLRNLKGESLGQ